MKKTLIVLLLFMILLCTTSYSSQAEMVDLTQQSKQVIKRMKSIHLAADEMNALFDVYVTKQGIKQKQDEIMRKYKVEESIRYIRSTEFYQYEMVNNYVVYYSIYLSTYQIVLQQGRIKDKEKFLQSYERDFTKIEQTFTHSLDGV